MLNEKPCWPAELTYDRRAGPLGERFPCKVCHKEFILGPGMTGPGMRFIHEVFKRRKFGAKKIPGIWMQGTEKERKYVYLRCQVCGWVIKTSADDVDKDGFVTPDRDKVTYMIPYYHCLVCPGCGQAHFAYLEGWKEAR